MRHEIKRGRFEDIDCTVTVTFDWAHLRRLAQALDYVTDMASDYADSQTTRTAPVDEIVERDMNTALSYVDALRLELNDAVKELGEKKK